MGAKKLVERKVTAKLDSELVAKALAASGTSLKATIQQGLELVARRSAYSAVLALKGKYANKDLGIELEHSRKDRDE